MKAPLLMMISVVSSSMIFRKVAEVFGRANGIFLGWRGWPATKFTK